MNTTVRNIFGVAAAILVLLGFNLATDSSSVSFNTAENDKVKSAESRSVNTLQDFNDAIVDIAEKTNPSVVTITTKRTEEVRVINPFAQFFGNPRDQGETRERTQRGLGSGVIVSEEGYILTNNHVIAETDEITVRMFNGNEVKAELVGTDPQTDIAVLKVEVNDLPAVNMGDSDNLKVGSFVLAIGSPLDESLAHTVSFGIVSARGRSLNNLTAYGDYIQTDAAINPGNSGGALIDVNGNLVGINSAIASRSGGNDGIGFAIPVNLAKRIMTDLIEDGEVSRGYLGMYTGGEVDQTMARALGLDNIRGVIVGRVEEGGPADKAGLQQQDVIVSLNGEQIRNWDAFRTEIASKKPGDKIELGLIRDGDEIELTVTLGERPEGEVAAADPAQMESMQERLGFTVTGLDGSLRDQLQLDSDTEGVVVRSISEGSTAYERGLRRGDVITRVKRIEVSSSSEFYDEVEKAIDAGDEVLLLTVLRNDIEQFIAFEL
ncbi:Do family serine endopeptidase [Gracilimonas amylolytica]|uniref:Do family serine endopeptidase n=1 Tax=Gracilimonas amylolytica TaxID=1749045 RepID=UPI000CD85B5F|nr:Do family serine endopeptidase [Gracilimonas amylolytica]